MQGILEKTSQINLLLDVWTSVNGKSYLAILASFCRNLNVLDNSTFPENVVSRRNPNTHLIAFHDVSLERHTSAYLKEIVIRTLADSKLLHKVASVTSDNASNNVTMVEMLDSDLNDEGLNEVGGIIKIRCFNHVFNLIFKKMMKHFEGENQTLVSRIDSLTTKLKNNVFLRTRFQQCTKKRIRVHCDTRILSRYKKFNALLRLTGYLKDFYFDKHMYQEYGFEKEDEKAFLYEQSEIDPLKVSLKLTRIIYDFTLKCQEDSANGLPYGIQYYMTLKRYFDGCTLLKGGSQEIGHFSNVGIDKKVLNSVSQEVRLGVLSSIIKARPLFENYYDYAMELTGYWGAHILQPDMKLASLDYVLDPQTKTDVERKVNDYVECYFEKCEKRGIGNLRKNNVKPRISPQKVRKLIKKPKPLDVLKSSLRSAELSVEQTKLFEFDQFNREPVETDVEYINYWLDNQYRYPKLSRPALSLYHSKLSTADVERCFSISKKALTGRYCLTSENLKRSMVLRNRLICFGSRRKFTNENFSTSAIVNETTEDE